MHYFCPLPGVLLISPEQAAGGIGKETAISFAEVGAKGVAFADINEDGALVAAEESKKNVKDTVYRVIAVKVDITNEDSVENMVKVVLKEFGRIDYSVNSAAVSQNHRPSLSIQQQT